MAKAEKPVPAEVATLLLAAAALERGDNVRARALAKQVLTSALPADENVKELVDLAAQYTSDTEPVTATLHSIAACIVTRSSVPPKTYLLALACAVAFTLLLLLALSRY